MDFRVDSLLSPLNQVGEVGRIREYDSGVIAEYKPDLILSDCGHGWDIRQVSKVPPFINLDSYIAPEVRREFVADVSYLGDPKDFGMCLFDLYRYSHKVKVYHTKLLFSPIYCGLISLQAGWHIYGSTKVSPVPKDDIGFRELDIIAAGGNPLKFRYKDQFLSECKEAIDGKRFETRLDKTEIFRSHTNYDRIGSILVQMGQNDLAKLIMEKKSDRCPSF